jgi:hypothetical protein
MLTRLGTKRRGVKKQHPSWNEFKTVRGIQGWIYIYTHTHGHGNCDIVSSGYLSSQITKPRENGENVERKRKFLQVKSFLGLKMRTSEKWKGKTTSKKRSFKPLTLLE